jgi:hypothetical protein
MKKKKKAGQDEMSPTEIALIKQLRLHPQMMDRFQSILEIANHGEGPLKTTDEVEALLIEEVRRLGHATMSPWAMKAEERVSQELNSQDPTVLSRKKNADVVVRLRVGGGGRADLVQSNSELFTPFAQALGSHAPGTVWTIGTGADGLWLRAFLCQGGPECPGTLWI